MKENKLIPVSMSTLTYEYEAIDLFLTNSHLPLISYIGEISDENTQSLKLRLHFKTVDEKL
jgi:hypothetical protein